MKARRPILTALAAGVMAAMSAAAFAGSTGTTTASTKLATTYTTFAGSQTNAEALVDGLRNGTAITLATTTPPSSAGGTSTTTDTTFQPATGKMGYGNVNLALALAQNDLATLGITDPTAAELAAALNGGSVTLADGSTQALPGVLALRAQGQGWGQIAKSAGLNLGAVVSASKNGHTQAGADHSQRGQDMASANRPEHPVHPDHPARPDRPQRPDVPHRPDIPDHAVGPGH
jgi:hypothetical protein